jgi:hypothetical protein
MSLEIVPTAASQSQRTSVTYSGASQVADRLSRRCVCTVERRVVSKIRHHASP